MRNLAKRLSSFSSAAARGIFSIGKQTVTSTILHTGSKAIIPPAVQAAADTITRTFLPVSQSYFQTFKQEMFIANISGRGYQIASDNIPSMV